MPFVVATHASSKRHHLVDFEPTLDLEPTSSRYRARYFRIIRVSIYCIIYIVGNIWYMVYSIYIRWYMISQNQITASILQH